MRRQFLKLWAIITGERKVVQARRERSYLKSFEAFYGKLSKKFITLHFALQTPEEFVNAVNNHMRSVYHFKDFNVKNVEVFNIFSPDKNEFLHTIYALKKPYGIFYIVVGTSEILFEFTEDINWEAQKAETFRIYEPSKNSTKAYYDIFYQCKLKKGVVKVYGVFKESLGPDGNFVSEAYDGIYGIKFPVEYEKLLI